MSLTEGDRKVAQPEVLYLVLARNKCDEVELVGEYVGVSVQELCTGKLVDEYVAVSVQELCTGKKKPRDLTPSQQWP